MIKFFRKIRYNLMSENKTGKYFKYAIGEILLVVIGILIALQANNWNEKRKSNKEQEVLLASLKEDLEADVIYLKDYLDRVELSNQRLIKQSKRVSNKAFTKDSLINFVKNDIDVFMVEFKGFNNSTYESMKASGKIELLNLSIKTPLFELYKLQINSENNYNILKNDYFDEIESLNENYPIPASFSFLKNRTVENIEWSAINEKDLLLRLNSWGTGKANFYRNVIGNFKNILDKTESILQMIEEKND